MGSSEGTESGSKGQTPGDATEHHPIEYGNFEGIIPEKQYGGGTVLLWDRGKLTPREDPTAGYKKGRTVTLCLVNASIEPAKRAKIERELNELRARLDSFEHVNA